MVKTINNETQQTNPSSFSSIFPLESSLDSTIHILLEFQRPALPSLLSTPAGGERRGIYAMAAMASNKFFDLFDSAVSGLPSDVSAVERRDIYAMAAMASSKFFVLPDSAVSGLPSDVSAVERRGIYAMAARVSSKKFLPEVLSESKLRLSQRPPM